MMAFVLAIKVYQQTLSNTAVSLTFLSIGLPALLLGVPAGVFADYIDRRTIMIFANLSRAILLLLFLFFGRYIIVIYLLAFVISSVTQLFFPAEGSIMADIVDKDDLLLANSLFSLSFYSSLALGFIASGPALSLFGHHYIFLFLSLCLFIASYFVYLLPKVKESKIIDLKINFAGKIKKMTNNVRESFSFILTAPDILHIILIITLAQVIMTVFSALVPGFADKVMRINVQDASYTVFGPTIFGILFGSIIINFIDRSLIDKRRVIGYILVLSAILIVLLSFSSFITSLAILFFLGIIQSFLLVPSYANLQQNVAKEFRGRVYGILTSFIGGASIFPAVIAGIIADMFGVDVTIRVLGITVLLFGLFRVRNNLFKKIKL